MSSPKSYGGKCIFCEMALSPAASGVVFADEHGIAFLDHRPLFAGHLLLIPRVHFETFADLPRETLVSLMQTAQLLSRAVEIAMRADGIFMAANNRVSQSVPHFHLHLVPRRYKDGLKGFFWPRAKYKDDEELTHTAQTIKRAIAQISLDRASLSPQQWVLQ